MSGDDDTRGFSRALEQAQAAIADLADQYIGWVTDDLARLRQAAMPLATGPFTDPAIGDQIKAAFDVAHDIKGQGGTFGYPLVTDVANLLCRYLEQARKSGHVDREVIDSHVEALETLIENRIGGNGGELGAEILESLKEAAAKAAP